MIGKERSKLEYLIKGFLFPLFLLLLNDLQVSHFLSINLNHIRLKRSAHFYIVVKQVISRAPIGIVMS